MDLCVEVVAAKGRRDVVVAVGRWRLRVIDRLKSVAARVGDVESERDLERVWLLGLGLGI